MVENEAEFAIVTPSPSTPHMVASAWVLASYRVRVTKRERLPYQSFQVLQGRPHFEQRNQPIGLLRKQVIELDTVFRLGKEAFRAIN